MITEFMGSCAICGRPDVEVHHCLFGTSARSLADADQLVLPLCSEHHRGNKSVHKQKELMALSNIIGQLAYEKKKCAEGYSEDSARQSFRIRYGRSYL